MNSISDSPLVIRTTGGSGGGGTSITEAGKEAIELYEHFESNARSFLDDELKTVQK